MGSVLGHWCGSGEWTGAYKFALTKSYDEIDYALLWKFIYWYVSYLVYRIHGSDIHKNGNTFFFFLISGSIHLY